MSDSAYVGSLTERLSLLNELVVLALLCCIGADTDLIFLNGAEVLCLDVLFMVVCACVVLLVVVARSSSR